MAIVDAHVSCLASRLMKLDEMTPFTPLNLPPHPSPHFAVSPSSGECNHTITNVKTDTSFFMDANTEEDQCAFPLLCNPPVCCALRCPTLCPPHFRSFLDSHAFFFNTANRGGCSPPQLREMSRKASGRVAAHQRLPSVGSGEGSEDGGIRTSGGGGLSLGLHLGVTSRK